ncbi:unnamed protein product [Arctia plantaginis]|uniref:Uncharacterized protein n=1 Tax=Arctia plantaginis TaxID=874455 RepID=A0A8S1BRG5_ARCPL|nr:unnamed protein product [Arctia plantaginis]
MGVFVKNATMSVSISLTVLKMAGLWAPEHLEGSRNCCIFSVGIYIIIQVVDLCIIWGDIALMTGTAFLLFTNLAQAAKIVNILGRRKRIQVIINDADKELSGIDNYGEGKIVKSCNKEMVILQALYVSVTFVTTLGWATSAEEGQLPLRAWYPYDTTRSPAYELTYVHQVVALLIAAYLNVAKDTLVAALIAQCTCRLRLIGHALENLAIDLEATDKVDDI